MDAPKDSVEDLSNKHISDSSSSFLSILDEKNKVIRSLKEQLANQKLQILYYMKKELDCTKLAELSSTCTPEYLEDSLPVILSLENFRREKGIKSNLYRLYEYMKQLDGRVKKSLNCQEYILRKIIEKLCIVMRSPDRFCIDLKIQHPTKQNICLDMFNDLLDATVCLRKKLDSFRICCNRLVVIEDERNNLVEQVISLPADEKYNCNFLMNIKQDKMELENKIKQLIKTQNLQNEEIKEVSILEKQLFKIQNELKTSIDENGDYSNVGDMINSLNFDAKFLYDATRKHHEKCLLNKTPSNIIKQIKTIFDGKEINKDEFNNEELKIFDAIKKEFDLKNRKTKNDIEKLEHENEKITNKLNELLIERNKLKIANIHLKSQIDKLNVNYSKETLLLKQQRDHFEKQVEELEELRKSYTELITMPSLESTEKEKEFTRTIKHLEKKLQLMRQIIKKQNREIVLHNEYGNNLKVNHDGRNKLDKIEPNNSITKTDSKQEFNTLTPNPEELIISELLNWTEEKQRILEDNIKLSNSSHFFQINPKDREEMKEFVQLVIKDTQAAKQANLSSTFSLEIKCSCKKGSTRQICTCYESELMRDCSNESLGLFCRPVQKNKDKNQNSLDSGYIPASSGYSRNIEVLVQNNDRLKNSSSESS